MTAPFFCPRCRSEIPAGSPRGLCPKCALVAGLEIPTEENRSTPPAPAPQFAPPTIEELRDRFPQLELLALVGQGGMGVVYQARQKELDRPVAVKILPPGIGRDQPFAERFAREARTLARLSHPNIVAIHDFGRTGDGLFYLVMEFVDGVNLRQAIRSGKIPPKEALAIVPQICDALQFAHEEGIVHRDIKPENILIDKKGRVKIADFGLAKLLGHTPGDVSLTGTEQVMGTLRYMAPEQLEATKAVDHRADIYSLGVVFYELLTGELPIGRFDPPSKKVQIDVRLDEVVLRAMEKEPERRYQHASEIKTEVEAIRGSSPVLPQQPTAWVSDSHFRARVWGLLAAWTALVAGLCLALLPWVMMEWCPWAYDERWEIKLKPQSGAYPGLTLDGQRRLYCWGQCGADANRLIARRPWTATARIEPAGAAGPAVLSLDAFREQWSWTTPAGESWQSQDEVPIDSVVQWMKAAGIDVRRPGVRDEAVALIGLLRSAARGVLPGDKSPRDYRPLAGGEAIGPFASHGIGGWGVYPLGMVGLPLDMDRNQLARRGIVVLVFLALWLPGLRLPSQRRRPPAQAAQGKRVAQRGRYAGRAGADAVEVQSPSLGRQPAESCGGSSSNSAIAAKLLFTMGALTVASAVFAFLLLVGAFVDTYHFDRLFRQDSMLIPLLALQALAVPAKMLMVFGGVSTRAHPSCWPRFGAALGIVPLTPAWLITLPLGIWTLTILRPPGERDCGPPERSR